MKQACIFFFLLFSVALQAQTDSAGVEFDTADFKLDTSTLKLLKVPDSTGFGTPDGKPVSKEIGAAGGAIISDDGRVELIFPEGALAVNTTISIQPVTNLLNGSGKAYQMEPSGTQFAKPVKIIFNYTDEEAETCPPDLKSFALQDDKGKWTSFEYDDWDSTTKKLSGVIHHFSTLVTNQNDVIIYPLVSVMRINRHNPIFVRHRQSMPQDPGLAGILPRDHADPEFAGNRLGLFVNGIFGGNGIVGKARVRHRDPSLVEQIGTYYSPEYLPPGKNAVEIKLAFQYYSRKKKKILWGSSKCYVKIYDEYKITVIYNFPHVCSAEFIDTSSFVTRLFKDSIEIREVINNPPTLSLSSKCAQFSFITANCIGPVNVRKELLTNYHVGSGSAPEIKFDFSRDEVLYFKFIIKTGGFSATPHEHSDISFPTQVKFKANGTEQTIFMPTGAASYRIIVKPINPPPVLNY